MRAYLSVHIVFIIRTAVGLVKRWANSNVPVPAMLSTYVLYIRLLHVLRVCSSGFVGNLRFACYLFLIVCARREMVAGTGCGGERAGRVNNRASGSAALPLWDILYIYQMQICLPL